MEERKAWEALQLAQERKAELCDILETERQEVERKAEEAKLQAEREETERIEEGERCVPLFEKSSHKWRNLSLINILKN